MSGKGQNGGDVLSWPKRLLSADDLRQHLNGQREVRLLPRTIVTPLAADELRARGVRIAFDAAVTVAATTCAATWGYAEEKPDALVSAAVQPLAREGLSLQALPSAAVVEIAQAVAGGTLAGAVLFCSDPGLACCIANKHSGLRAAAVLNAAQVSRSRSNLAPNFFAVEMPSRTLFELRQILRVIAGPAVACSAKLAAILKELDGHAHR